MVARVSARRQRTLDAEPAADKTETDPEARPRIPRRRRIVIGTAATLGAIGGSFGLSVGGPLISASIGNDPRPAGVVINVVGPEAAAPSISEGTVIVMPRGGLEEGGVVRCLPPDSPAQPETPREDRESAKG
jgi:hypothetical protein